jgi:hypothetical protein
MTDDLVKRVLSKKAARHTQVIELCGRIEALTAENERLRTHLAAVRDEVLEEAAKVADCFHERALEWAKSVRGLTEHLTETDSSRIATTIRAMKGDGK